MNSSAVLLLVVGVLSNDAGTLQVDAGRLAGLRVGDRGAVFYELKVRDDVRRVDVAEAEVVAVADNSATLRAPAGEPIRSGFRVEFSLPLDRLDRRAPVSRPSPAEGELRRELESARAKLRDVEREVEASREQLREAERDLESSRAARVELERSLAAARSNTDGESQRLQSAEAARTAAETRVEELEERLSTARRSAGEAMSELRASLDQEKARSALLQSELKTAQATLAEPAPVESMTEAPEPEVASEPLEASHDPEPAPGGEMLRLEEGRYAIGLPVAEASFYNHTPRFTRQLAGLWVDSKPVRAEEFAKASESRGTAGPAGAQTGLTFAEATSYCEQQGKRLPSEVEWEAAFTTLELEAQGPLLEWTSSWYLPYPGNDRPEADYGERYRVIRSSNGSRRDRRYMAPGDRDAAVGFRCVREAATG